ncbi:4Fe-4S binding protein [Helicobacter mustelae]|uniref:4Fe-4S binding protein n=1 Tax=Helicobacter mustelae TaxID=217 RepID=UPI0002F01B32|nr:4Fe-4S binding protein [Helicobacter mustelae]SQH71867.1 ferredoxin-type protein NapF [Helicobacter mustelae]STP13006.1 ferredoxin-type protein NapF [Helicobacter mustelae]
MRKKQSTSHEVDPSRRKLFFGFGKKDCKEIPAPMKKVAIIHPLTCLAYQKVICYACKDICREHISFQGLFFPEILPSCIGCDRCEAICPQNAISLKEIPISREEIKA